MIDIQYVWLTWSLAFLVPWTLLFVAFPRHRKVMLWASLFTMPFGLTEPLFVPSYWNPPSVFDLASRTGFDIESLIFCFGIGGTAAVLFDILSRAAPTPVALHERSSHRHRFHRAALASPFVVFLLTVWLDWNAIYPAILAMVIGAVANVLCRPDLLRSTLVGSAGFVLYYAAFFAALEWMSPGYVERVWNLEALTGWIVFGLPVEEILFAAGFGGMWAGVFHHYTWHARRPAREASSPQDRSH